MPTCPSRSLEGGWRLGRATGTLREAHGGQSPRKAAANRCRSGGDWGGVEGGDLQKWPEKNGREYRHIRGLMGEVGWYRYYIGLHMSLYMLIENVYICNDPGVDRIITELNRHEPNPHLRNAKCVEHRNTANLDPWRYRHYGVMPGWALKSPVPRAHCNPVGLLGVQLTQLHALEVQTCAAASSWEKPDGHDSGVLAGLVSKICNNTPSSCAWDGTTDVRKLLRCDRPLPPKV